MDALDDLCLNVYLHQQGQDDNRHCIDIKQLVKLIKEQLDYNLDYNCMLFGACGSYSAPFKITCAVYSYMIGGKRITS